MRHPFFFFSCVCLRNITQNNPNDLALIQPYQHIGTGNPWQPSGPTKTNAATLRRQPSGTHQTPKRNTFGSLRDSHNVLSDIGDDSDVEMLENLMYETGASSDDAFDALEATGYQGLDAAVEWLEQTLLRRTGLSIAEMEDYQAEMEEFDNHNHEDDDDDDDDDDDEIEEATTTAPTATP
mmetsp:Transcript_5815/g.12085  ORF Transcript_5815/g.12085 Transcript_5815/m.12085 type:complete len:180 (-) Transcript_5815:259-798(-)